MDNCIMHKGRRYDQHSWYILDIFLSSKYLIIMGWPMSQIQQAITICKQIVFTFCNASYLNSHFWWHRSHQMHDSSTLLLKDATALLSYRYGNNDSVFSLAFFCSSQFFNNYTAVPENSTFYFILSTAAKKKINGWN